VGSPSYTGRDNANQITLQDGIAPISDMYLWQPIGSAFYPPCVDATST
jgi:extracellular elastinolytic metalloproteinase